MLQTITTTELRTKSRLLVDSIKYGGSVRLLHRSRIIATIKPRNTFIKLFNTKGFSQIVSKLNLTPLSSSQIKDRYQKHLLKKYG